MIYTVNEGETVFSVAKATRVSPTRLIEENGLLRPYDILPGQTLSVTRPERIYTVRGGDTLRSVCNRFGISPRALLRANPQLCQDPFLYPGQILSVHEPTPKAGCLSVWGYADGGDAPEAILPALPYLSSLTLFGYRWEEGRIQGPSLAKKLREAPCGCPRIVAGMTVDRHSASFWQAVRHEPEALCKQIKARGLGGLTLRPEEPADVAGNDWERLREVMLREGLILAVAIGISRALRQENLIGSHSYEADGVLLLDDMPEATLKTKVEWMRACTSERDRERTYPPLSSRALERTVDPQGLVSVRSMPLAEALVPARRYRIPLSKHVENGTAFYQYKSRAGRQARRHERMFEDIGSFKEGLDAIEQARAGGVCCDAVHTPAAFLYLMGRTFGIYEG